MNGLTAVLGLEQPFSGLPLAAFSKIEKPSRHKRYRALEIERVLKHARLTMVELSAQTRMRFGEESPYVIPKTFLYKQKIGITPHICQVAAFSEVTGYCFADCMSMCGFDLGLILQLQLRIPNERTTMLVPGPGFPRDGSRSEETYSTANSELSRYCYAKIGSRDAVAYPAVRPGCIVRVDRCYSREFLNHRSSVENLWLVEHPAGTTCCRVKAVANSEVVLLPNRPPLFPWPLRLPTEARILGLVDRHLLPEQNGNFDLSHRGTEQNRPIFSPSLERRTTVSRLLRMSRLRTGLTFREAHKMTLRIATLLQNRDFGISVSLLSDYEAMNKLPRHIAKIITLCAIYGINPREFLRAGGIQIQDSAKRWPFTDERSGRQNAGRVSNRPNELSARGTPGRANLTYSVGA
jgi:hypothetical protein